MLFLRVNAMRHGSNPAPATNLAEWRKHRISVLFLFFFLIIARLGRACVMIPIMIQ